ncbi:MAG: hypothetical protein K1X66_04040 [Verrucomicrobiae bacterium]|nr:hypothetical protein [Verrucomicrobiae bacterium]
MAEPSIPEKIASSNQNAKEAFLKTIDVIMEVGKRAYQEGVETEAKRIENCVEMVQSRYITKQGFYHKSICGSASKIERDETDCSNSIELQTHPVALGYYHTSIRLTPKGEKYKDDPRFKQVDELGRHYTTVGAGPVYNRLVADADRPKDIGPHHLRIPMGVKNCKNTSIMIETILAKYNNFRNDLDYDLFPAKEYNQAWYWADDSHNSNSFISGLIDASYLEKPYINTELHPGWERPVPNHYFREKEEDYIPEETKIEESKKKNLIKEIYKEDKNQREMEKAKEDYIDLKKTTDTWLKIAKMEKQEAEKNKKLIELEKLKLKQEQERELEKLEMTNCRRFSGGEMCAEQISSKSPPFENKDPLYEALERVKEEIANEKKAKNIIFEKIDDFKKSDVFKFMEQQVDGVTKILPKF